MSKVAKKAKKIYLKFKNKSVEFIYPRRCISCESIFEFSEEEFICFKCSEKFKNLKSKRCQKCGRVINRDGKCRICNEKGNIYFDKGFSVFIYKGEIRESVKRFKYSGLYRYGDVYGKIMRDFAKNNIEMKYDYITGVPLHISKFISRGYNQSDILARFLGKAFGIESKSLLKRVKNTKPQNNMDRLNRRKNIKNAFKMKKNAEVKGKDILIVDDIFTTGATINECAKVLKRAGARKVDFFAICATEED